MLASVIVLEQNTGMSFSEQADYSAENTEEYALMDLLSYERDAVGSTSAYLHATGVYFESVPEHAANMLQLQRMARMAVNPNNEASFPATLTNAFYWGEILAYTAQERVIGDTWAAYSYEIFNKNINGFYESWRNESISHYENQQRVGQLILKDLGLFNDAKLAPGMGDLLHAWAGDLTSDMDEYKHVLLGFRHVMQQVIEEENIVAEENVAEAALAAKDEFNGMLQFNKIDDTKGVELETIADVRSRLLEGFLARREAYGQYNTNDPEAVDDEKTYLAIVMKKQLNSMEGVDEGDYLRLGSGSFVLYDADGAPGVAYVLGENECIEGTVATIDIATVPSSHGLEVLRGDDRVTPSMLPEDYSDPFGLLLVVEYPVLINADGERIQLGAHKVAGIVLNDEQTELWRYLA